MALFDILAQDVPLGGTAVAYIQVYENGSPEDVTTVNVKWKRPNGTLIGEQTHAGVDQSGNSADGTLMTLTNPAGVGNYQATLVIVNDGTYTPPATGLNFTLEVTITDEDGSQSKIFTFRVVPTSLTITLDTATVISAIRRQARLIEDVSYLADATGPTIGGNRIVSLGAGIIYAIDAAFKNAAIIDGTNYTWVEGRPNVVLLQAPAVNDFFLFRVQKRLSNQAIQDYITTSMRTVQSMLKGFYNDANLMTYATVQNLVKDHALGQIKEDLSEGVALESAVYRSGHERHSEVVSLIKDIQMGRSEIIDNDGDIVTRTAGGIVGGKRGPKEIKNREDIRQYLANFDKVALTFYPFRGEWSSR